MYSLNDIHSQNGAKLRPQHRSNPRNRISPAKKYTTSLLAIYHQLTSQTDTTYLDHAGTTLYSQSLISNFSADLSSNLYGNPHSASPSSALSTARVNRVRSRVLQFFNANPEHFDVVFVANATAAIKLVMQGFVDYSSEQEHSSSTESHSGFWYAYHYDAHTSLVGIRELASRGSLCFTSDTQVEDWLNDKPNPANEAFFSSPLRAAPGSLGLFAYPAQSNLNGHRPSLSWPGRLRSSFHPQHTKTKTKTNHKHKNIYTLLDAAAYVTTASLDLSNAASAPDFTALSFYKIFGFPDLGCLIVRKEAAHILTARRKYFGGGTVDMVISLDEEWVSRKSQSVHDVLEDGTLAFHSIIALEAGMDSHARIFGSMGLVQGHVGYLGRVLYEGLVGLRHGDGGAVCVVYKHAGSRYGDGGTQGPTVAFNIRDARGGWVGKSDVERLAIARGIQIRTGGVCNPGGIATYLGVEGWELRRNFAGGMRCGDELDVLEGKPTGVVRVSLGAMSSLRDVEVFIRFVRECFVEGVGVLRVKRGLGVKKEGEFGCPVVGCWRGFETREELHDHFAVHGEKLVPALAVRGGNADDGTDSVESLDLGLKGRWRDIPGTAIVDIRPDRPATSGKDRSRWRKRFGFGFGFRRRASGGACLRS